MESAKLSLKPYNFSSPPIAMAAFNLVTRLIHIHSMVKTINHVFFFPQWKTFSRMLICIHRISYLRSSCLPTKYFQDIQIETTLTVFRPAALAVCKSCVTKLQMFEKHISARTFLAHKCAKKTELRSIV